MFGGIAFLTYGNMTVGVHGDELIARISPEHTEAALAEPDVRAFDITGRPMKGWVLVAGEELDDDVLKRSYGGLVPHDKDLDVLVVIAARQQPQQRETLVPLRMRGRSELPVGHRAGRVRPGRGRVVRARSDPNICIALRFRRRRRVYTR